MEFIKIAVIIFVAVILVSCLPVYDNSVSNIIGIAVCTIVLIYIISCIIPVIMNIRSFIEKLDFDFSLIFKCMGISLITQFVSDIASDSGNKALSNQMIFAGKVAVTALALPLFAQVIEIIGRLIV